MFVEASPQEATEVEKPKTLFHKRINVNKKNMG